MEWGEQSLELAPSTTEDTFSSPQTTPSESVMGYSFESDKSPSPVIEYDNDVENDDDDEHHDPMDEEEEYDALPSFHDNSQQHPPPVGNVVLVPRLAISMLEDKPTTTKTPSDSSYQHIITPAPRHIPHSYHPHHGSSDIRNHHPHYSAATAAAFHHHATANSIAAGEEERQRRRRRIVLQLQEEVQNHHQHHQYHHQGPSSSSSDATKRGCFFFRASPRFASTPSTTTPTATHAAMEVVRIDRGTITVSWYDGTASLELQEHVERMVLRTWNDIQAATTRTTTITTRRTRTTTRLQHVRLLDERVDPPEEIVLSPFLPDGSRFVLRFRLQEEEKEPWRDGRDDSHSSYSRPALGASPSPYPSTPHHALVNLSATQLALLASQWPTTIETTDHPHNDVATGAAVSNKATASLGSFPAGILKHPPSYFLPAMTEDNDAIEQNIPTGIPKRENRMSKSKNKRRIPSAASSKGSIAETDDDDLLSMHPDDILELRLRKMTELLLQHNDNDDHQRRNRFSQSRRQEKRQVMLVLANYIGLFVSLIAISAEIQARAPYWQAWMEREFANVQQCSTDQEALFHCISNGDFAGLVASVILWLSRSASTQRIFWFGFHSPKQLWMVVYEALVSGLCWGFSYLFIRRALKPEIRKNYFQNHWKDAVYGSLAIFNASFMKQVLKNLIPQERLEEVLQQKQLNIFSWFPYLIKK